MLTKIKQWRENLKQKRQTRHEKFQIWKQNFNEKYQENFPIPKLDKSTAHLLKDESNRPNTESMITTKKMIKFWLLWLCIVVLWYMMYISLSYLYMVIAAFIISLALEWCIIFRQRLTKSRWIWILITYLIATIFVLSGFIVLFPFFFNRWTELLQSLMTRLLNIETSIIDLWVPWYIEQLGWLPDFCKSWLIERFENSNSDDLLMVVRDNIWSIMATSSDYVKFIAWQAINIFGNIFWIIADFAIVLTLCIFFSVAHYDIKYSLKYLFRHIKSWRSRIDSAYSGISVWLKNQLFLCIFIGLASYVGLRILELFWISIPQKWTLALIAGLLEIIPYLWPWIWALPAAISALIFSGRWWVLAIVILYTIIQQSEEKILVPFLMWKALGVSPLLVFICIIFCGCIMWLFWILLAVPMAVIVSLAFHVPQPADKEIEDSSDKKFPTKKQKITHNKQIKNK